MSKKETKSTTEGKNKLLRSIKSPFSRIKNSIKTANSKREQPTNFHESADHDRFEQIREDFIPENPGDAFKQNRKDSFPNNSSVYNNEEFRPVAPPRLKRPSRHSMNRGERGDSIEMMDMKLVNKGQKGESIEMVNMKSNSNGRQMLAGVHMPLRKQTTKEEEEEVEEEEEEEEENDQRLNDSKTDTIKTLRRNDTQPSGDKTALTTEDSKILAKSPAQKVSSSDGSTKKEERPNPTGNFVSQTPDQTEILKERLKNLRVSNQTFHQASVSKKRASTEETPRPKRFNSNEEDSLVEIQQPECSSDQSKQTPDVEKTTEQENQEKYEHHGAKGDSDQTFQRNQQKNQDTEFFPFEPTQHMQKTEQQTKVMQETTHTKFFLLSSNQQKQSLETEPKIHKRNENLEGVPSLCNQDNKSLQITPKSTQNCHPGTQNQNAVSKSATTENVPKVVEAFNHRVIATERTKEPQDKRDNDSNVIKPLKEEKSITGSIEKNIPNGEEKFVKGAMQDIKSIVREIEKVEKEMGSFRGVSPDHRDFAYMDELMMRNLIKLDNIETRTNQDVRQERKKGIQYIQAMLKKLDAKLKENQRKAKEAIIDKSVGDKKDDVNKKVDDGIKEVEVETSIKEVQPQETV